MTDLSPILSDIEEIELIEYLIRKLINLRNYKGYIVENEKIICDLCGNHSIIENYVGILFRTDTINCKHCNAKFLSKSVIQELNIDEEDYLRHIKVFIIERDKKNITLTRRYMANHKRLEKEHIYYSNKWDHLSITSSEKILERSRDKQKISRLKTELTLLKNSIELPVNTGFDYFQNKLMKSFDIVIETFNNTEKKYKNRYVIRDPLKIYVHFIEFKVLFMEKIPKYPGLNSRINLIERNITEYEYNMLIHVNYLYIYNNESVINTLKESISVVSKIWNFYCTLLDKPNQDHYLKYFRNMILVDLGTIKKLLDSQ